MSSKKLSVREMLENVLSEPQLQHLRDENRRLQGIIDSSRKADGEQSEIVQELKDEIEVAVPPVFLYKPAKKAGKSVASLVVQLTDLHIGQKTEPSEIEGFGEFNFKLATERMATLAKKLIDWTVANRSAYTINECVVLGTGDYISGDIHPELLVTNEFPSPVQSDRPAGPPCRTYSLERV